MCSLLEPRNVATRRLRTTHAATSLVSHHPVLLEVVKAERALLARQFDAAIQNCNVARGLLNGESTASVTDASRRPANDNAQSVAATATVRIVCVESQALHALGRTSEALEAIVRTATISLQRKEEEEQRWVLVDVLMDIIINSASVGGEGMTTSGSSRAAGSATAAPPLKWISDHIHHVVSTWEQRGSAPSDVEVTRLARRIAAFVTCSAAVRQLPAARALWESQWQGIIEALDAKAADGIQQRFLIQPSSSGTAIARTASPARGAPPAAVAATSPTGRSALASSNERQNAGGWRSLVPSWLNALVQSGDPAEAGVVSTRSGGKGGGRGRLFTIILATAVALLIAVAGLHWRRRGQLPPVMASAQRPVAATVAQRLTANGRPAAVLTL